MTPDGGELKRGVAVGIGCRGIGSAFEEPLDDAGVPAPGSQAEGRLPSLGNVVGAGASIQQGADQALRPGVGGKVKGRPAILPGEVGVRALGEQRAQHGAILLADGVKDR
ncbi:MAG: hypothetical protein NZ658_02475, partial [Pirellulales bacterium]|nr:hypothetical protein [Pirellulales bacterium]